MWPRTEDDCREYAAKILVIAQMTSNEDERDRLRGIAERWLALATDFATPSDIDVPQRAGPFDSDGGGAALRPPERWRAYEKKYELRANSHLDGDIFLIRISAFSRACWGALDASVSHSIRTPNGQAADLHGMCHCVSDAARPETGRQRADRMTHPTPHLNPFTSSDDCKCRRTVKRPVRLGLDVGFRGSGGIGGGRILSAI
jgi:hypothetical protein